MSEYKSAYTGQEVDAGIAKANTAIQDISGKQDLLVSGTNIKTINYNSLLGSGNINIGGGSTSLTITSNLVGKKVSFIGDSITTYSGYLPSGNASRYPRSGDPINSVDKTWWMKLITNTGMVLGQNCAWDGSTVTGLSTSTTDAYGACSDKRIGQIDDNGNPDIVICFIGINDWGGTYNKTHTHYGGSFVDGTMVTVGSYTGETAAPSGELKTFSEAYGAMIYKIQTSYPSARVYCCTLLPTNGKATYNYDGDGVFPSLNRDGISVASYNNCIRMLANNMNAGVIEFADCGISWGNMSSYLHDGLHPNETGMTLLANKAQRVLESEYGFTIVQDTVTSYTITNNLTHTTNSNAQNSIVENNSYSASLSSDAHYTLSTVTVTMGGVDVTSSVYSNGEITISSVTGDIVITATSIAQTYTITNTLSHVNNSNSSQSITYGNSYTATLTPDADYNISSVTVTMDDVDVTSTVYNNGSINITNVLGNIVIVATATQSDVYTITNNLANVTNSNNAQSVIDGGSYSATLTPNSHYNMSTVTVTMGGVDITSSAYTPGTGVINISSVTGNVIITAIATIEQYSITNTLTNVTNSNTDNSVNYSSVYSGVLTADADYTMDGASITITMGGTDITSTAYNTTNHTISIASVTGNIVIIATAVPSAAVLTWYTNVSQTSTNSFVASSKAWALGESDYAAAYGKPINRVSFVATANSGTIDFCVASAADNSHFGTSQVINWDSSNKVGNIVTVELPTPITLTTGQYLVVFKDGAITTGCACYKQQTNITEGRFYSYVGNASHPNWGASSNLSSQYSIQMNLGYYG